MITIIQQRFAWISLETLNNQLNTVENNQNGPQMAPQALINDLE